MFVSLNSINPFPNKPWFVRGCSSRLLKTLWEKEKLLGTNNFSFSHSVWYLFEELSAVFIRLKLLSAISFSFGKVLNLLFGKGLRPRLPVLVVFKLALCLQKMNFLPRLFLEKSQGIGIALAAVVLLVCRNICNVSVIIEDIFLNLRVCVH